MEQAKYSTLQTTHAAGFSMWEKLWVYVNYSIDVFFFMSLNDRFH